MSIDITTNRISATPRSKYHKYGIASDGGTSSSGGGGTNIDTSNFVKKTGETEQTIEGDILVTGDVIAYSTGQSTENYPIASDTALGMIKIGKNLTIDDDGTLSATAGGEGASKWSEIKEKPSLLTDANIKKWDEQSHKHENKELLDSLTEDSLHTHANKAKLDVIDQNLSTSSDVNFKSVKATEDVVAYSTGVSVENYPIASSTAVGMIKVGKNLTISEDGTLNAQAGGEGASEWSEIKNKPTTLAGYGITDGAKSSDLKSHTDNTAIHITSDERTKWNDANSKKHTHSNKTVLDGITSTNITNWNDANSKKHTHSNKAKLDVIDQNLSTSSDVTFNSVKAINDVVAYSTGSGDITLPIASSSALGTIKVGKNLTIDSDGTLNAQAGGVSSWNDLKDKPTTLAGYGITDGAKATDLTAHTGNTTVHITADERTKWNDANSKKHTHSNKTVLDGITSTNVTNWNDANSKKHSHSNKSVIDGITETNITNWNDANAKKHTHANKSKLDVIDQNLSTTSDVNFKSVKATGDIVAYSTGQSTEKYPIASSTALGTIKVGSGLNISTDGTLSATATGGGQWGQITGTLSNQTDLKDALDAKSPKNHTHTTYASKVTVGTTAYTVTNNNVTIPAYPTTLKNPNALTISLNGTSQGAYDGSSAKSINITAASIGASASTHTHSYIPLSGGTMTGGQIARAGSAQSWVNGRKGAMISLTTAGANQYMPIWSVKSQEGSWDCGTYTSNRLHFSYITDANFTAGQNIQTANIYFNTNGTITAGLNGNATTATTLQTARTINGTSFNGSANITTANWGTARNIYISDSTGTNTGTGISVNGGANATLKLPATIKASLTGNASTATTLQTARTIWGQTFNGSKNVSGDMTGVGSITASGTIRTSADVVAYSTGSGDITLPIASSKALGTIKVGSGLSITSDGTLSATGAGSIGQITVSGTGNVITNATKNGNTITFTKDVTALTTANYTSTLDSKYLKLTGGTLTGALTATKFTSNIANGTAPFSVTSKTVCTNLNADLLDGYNANGLFTSLVNSGNSISVAIGGTTKKLTVGYASNADQLDGYHASSLESYKLTVIDASGLNNNTWYPVTMAIGNSLQTRIRVEGNTAANASWNTRTDKMMSLILDYTVNGSNWGWTSPFRTVNAYQEGAGCNKCLRGLGQLTNSSTEYVYIRGGAKYNFYVSRFITPVLRTSTFTASNQSVAPTTTEPAAIVRNAALVSDNVATATKLQTARTINGTAFDGSANITTTNWGTARNIYIADSSGTNTGAAVSVNGSANATLKLPATIKASLTGNATTATTLQTARTINGTSFNGSANITTANWGTARNIYISDSTGTNTGAAVSVNGGANATLKLPASIKASLTGNASTATTLQTARTLWGQTFNGSKNVSGNMTGVGSITASGTIKTTADVVAYSTGTSVAPFKYWYPSVNSSGVLSWTNSTSTTTPNSVNIKGAKGDKGTSVSSVTQTTTSTADGGTNVITCKLSDGTTTTFSIKNGSKGSTGATGATGPKGATGPQGPAGPATDTYTNIYLKNTSWPTVYFKANSASGAIYLHARGNDSGLYSLYIAHGKNSNHNQSFASNGSVWFRGSLTQNSDIRLKNRLDNVTNVLEDLNEIQVFKYTLKGDDSNTVKIGLSAQDLLKVYPELVELSPTDTDGNKYYSVNYSCLSVIALQACKELHQLVKNQQAKIAELEEKLNKIETNNIQ